MRLGWSLISSTISPTTTLWNRQNATGERRHQAVSCLGASLSKTVIKPDILTEDDCMSKVGTKHAAMISDPVQYLANIGEADTLTEQDAALAEKYFVCVWAGAMSTTTAKRFDDFRVEICTSGSTGIDALPPTSSGIRCHIRMAFLVHTKCHLLATAKEPKARLEPTEHGWKEHFGKLLPSKCLKPLSRILLTVCKSAGKCDYHRCGFHAAGDSCTVSCHGKSSCKNPSH